MNRVGEAVKAQFNNVKALAALGGVTVAALVGGGPLAPITAATPAKAPRAEGAHTRKAIPLEALGPLGQQTVVAMVEQKPEAFYNGEVVLDERDRTYARKGLCYVVGKRCVSSLVENFKVSYYNPLLIPRTKSANLNNPTSGDFAIGTIVEEPGNGDVNGGGPPNYCAAFIDKPSVMLVATNVGETVAAAQPATDYQVASSAKKLTGIQLQPNNVLQPSVEYVTFPLDSGGGLEYGLPTNPLTGQVYQDPEAPVCTLPVADDAYTNY
jgi:hypothetical protein